MITVEEAQNRIAETIEVLPKERVPIEQSLGRVLRETLHADRDAPPFNRSTFDGIALNYAAIESGQDAFPIAGTAFAGSPKLELNDLNSCVEIMTGAPLPDAADCVVKVEDLEIESGTARIKNGTPLSTGHGVHPKGSDCQKGEALLGSGRKLSAKELSIAASLGKAKLFLSAQPSIAIVTTGDELVAVDETPLPNQIRRSNDLALETALRSAGFDRCQRFHISDDRSKSEALARKLVERFDVIILAGGVSKGKMDFLPEALEAAGVRKEFQWVAQRPGKPLWFGIAERDDSPGYVFALPGNPVSCFTCLHRYVLPALERMSGLAESVASPIRLSAGYEFKPPLTLFLPVRTRVDGQGRNWAEPLPFNTSGDYISVASTQGFVELPPDRTRFEEGDVVPYRLWRT